MLLSRHLLRVNPVVFSPWKGICPFHVEGVPTLAVEGTAYHCGTCDARGRVVSIKPSSAQRAVAWVE